VHRDLHSFPTRRSSDLGAAFIDKDENWKSFFNSYTYLLLSDHSSPSRIEEFLNTVAKKKYTTNDYQASFELQRLDKIVPGPDLEDRKSTRLNSSHVKIS